MKLFRRYSQRRFFLGWLIILTLHLVYTELFVYYSNTWNWNYLTCKSKRDCTKILLVADPQIIGIHNEVLHAITPLSIFDSDRYLKKTYRHAFNFVEPDVVIFLGDLMDEASTATDEEFNMYVRRLFDIFLDHSRYVKHIWLPGDNDIGGEFDDPITDKKLKRFDRAFQQPDLIHINNYTFFKINVLTQTIPVYKKKREFYDTSEIFIGLSHIPLLFYPTPFVEKMLSKMLPQLSFTAHKHKSMIVSMDALLHSDRQIIPITPDNTLLFEYELGNTDMYEILIPTCSYRMGTNDIGFGYAILEKNRLQYTVLWSPSRFEQLHNYMMVMSLFIVFSAVMCCLKFCCFKCR